MKRKEMDDYLHDSTSIAVVLSPSNRPPLNRYLDRTYNPSYHWNRSSSKTSEGGWENGISDDVIRLLESYTFPYATLNGRSPEFGKRSLTLPILETLFDLASRPDYESPPGLVDQFLRPCPCFISSAVYPMNPVGLCVTVRSINAGNHRNVFSGFPRRSSMHSAG